MKAATTQSCEIRIGAGEASPYPWHHESYMEAFKSLPRSWWGAGEKSAGGWFHHLPTDSTTYFHRPEDIV